MSGLRPSPRIRAERLAEKVRRRELQGSTGLSAPERAWQRARELAPVEELEELHNLCELARSLERESPAFGETLLKAWELQERIMRREAPTLAAIIRTERCLFWRSLCVEAERAEAAYDEGLTTSYPSLEEADDARQWLEERHYGLSTALIDRRHAISSGAEPITDMDEAERLVQEVLKAVDAGDTDRVLRLVGRI